MKNKAGFTLVELMVVIAITAILAALGGPAVMDYMRTSGVNSAADKLFTDLHRTRSLAIKQRNNAAINFDQANNRYQVVLTDPSTGVVTNLPVVEFGNYRGGVRLFNDPNGNPPAASIAFTFQGSCPVGGSGAVFLTNQDQTIYYRLRATLSGGISLHRWDRASGRWISK